MEPLAFPARISVEVTNRCNQTCRMCPRSGFTRPLGLMDAARFRRVVDQIAPHPTDLLLHFLGEPTLHPHLVELVAYAAGAGVRSVTLSTNATLLDADLRAGLLTSGLHRLDCSLDANDPHEYLMMRGTDDFERASAHVRAFLVERAQAGGTGPAVALQYVETPQLARDLPAIVDAWRPLLGERDFVKTITPAPFRSTVPDGVRPAAEVERTPCLWLFGSLMVLQDGTVTMCGADWDAQAPLGHVDDQTIAEIWRGPELTRRRRAHLDGRFGDVELCGSCDDWYLADGHGYRNALTNTGEARLAIRVRARD